MTYVRDWERKRTKTRRAIGCVSFWILAAQVAFSPAIYFAVLNALGPSTGYYEPTIEGAQIDGDGKYVAYLGDRIFVRYIVVRHEINGNCLLNVWRYGEEIGGPNNGKRHLLDYADLQFVGADELRRPRWPINGLVLGYDVDRRGEIQRDKPLLSPDADEQEFALYVVARYRCNFLDYLFPRYIQGGPKEDETERVNVVIKRHRP